MKSIVKLSWTDVSNVCQTIALSTVLHYCSLYYVNESWFVYCTGAASEGEGRGGAAREGGEGEEAEQNAVQGEQGEGSQDGGSRQGGRRWGQEGGLQPRRRTDAAYPETKGPQAQSFDRTRRVSRFGLIWFDCDWFWFYFDDLSFIHLDSLNLI